MSIITISTGIFSGGDAVASKLAEQLDYPCIGIEDLYGSMRQFGLPERICKTTSSELLESISSPSRRVAIMDLLRAALLYRAKDGNLIYHGMVGHLLFSSLPNILKVHINNSMDNRIQTAMHIRKLCHGDAATFIQEDDFRCDMSIRNLYKVDWRDSLMYDIALNLSHISVASSVDILGRMAGYQEFQASDYWQKAYHDLELSCKVWATLSNTTQTAKAEVTVNCSDGDVTIHGYANSGPEVMAIKQVANKVPGVKRVISNVAIGGDTLALQK